MSSRDEQYQWWLLNGDLDIVSDGSIAGSTLLAALAALSGQLVKLGYRGERPVGKPYSVIVYKGGSVVAVRPSTVGIC
jgi:hypothetical protein